MSVLDKTGNPHYKLKLEENHSLEAMFLFCFKYHFLCFEYAWNIPQQVLLLIQTGIVITMQQFYERTPILKFYFSKVAFQHYWNPTSAWMFPWMVGKIFRAPF